MHDFNLLSPGLWYEKIKLAMNAGNKALILPWTRFNRRPVGSVGRGPVC